jgi:hypothetical protein
MEDLQKEFVPYELAIRMEQLGFDEPCLGYYNSNGKFKTKQDEYELYLICNSKWISPACSAPTWQSAFRWFREKYKLYLNIESQKNESGFWVYITNNTDYLLDIETKTYEEAELACLEKLLEIVEQSKSQ